MAQKRGTTAGKKQKMGATWVTVSVRDIELSTREAHLICEACPRTGDIRSFIGRSALLEVLRRRFSVMTTVDRNLVPHIAKMKSPQSPRQQTTSLPHVRLLNKPQPRDLAPLVGKVCDSDMPCEDGQPRRRFAELSRSLVIPVPDFVLPLYALPIT